MKLITRQECEHLRQRFEAYCEIAEQHEFATLFQISTLIEATWENLDYHLEHNQEDLRAMFRVILKNTGAPWEAKNYEDLG